MFGQVASVGHVDRNRKVGFQSKSGRLRTAQPDFFLGGKDKIQVIRHRQRHLGHGQQQGDAADAVVQIGAADDAVLLEHGCVKHGKIAHLYHLFGFFPAGCADVHKQMLHLQVLKGGLFFVGDHTPHAVGKPYLNVDEVAAEQTADRGKPQKAVVIDEGDDNAQRVHVSGQQDFAAAFRPGRFFVADEVAECIGPDLVCVLLCQLGQHVAYPGFPAGRAERAGQRFI